MEIPRRSVSVDGFIYEQFHIDDTFQQSPCAPMFSSIDDEIRLRVNECKKKSTLHRLYYDFGMRNESINLSKCRKLFIPILRFNEAILPPIFDHWQHF